PKSESDLIHTPSSILSRGPPIVKFADVTIASVVPRGLATARYNFACRRGLMTKFVRPPVKRAGMSAVSFCADAAGVMIRKEDRHCERVFGKRLLLGSNSSSTKGEQITMSE